MSRFLAVFSSFLIMLCLGGVYAWSLFVPMLKKQLLYSTSQTQIIVGLTLGIFALSMIYAGKVQKKYGPQLTALIGAVSLVSGYLLAYVSDGDFLLMCFAIGCLCGIGTGFGYVCCLVVPAHAFPDRKGLATGIAIGGFGAGAILLTYVVKFILSVHPESTVLEIFKWIGIVYGILISIAILFLKYKKVETIDVHETALTFSFTESRFIILFFTMFLGTFAGLLILGNAKPMALSMGYAEDIATTAVTLLALGNMSGRIFWGWLIDKTGVDKALFIAYSILFAAIVLIQFTPPSEWLFNIVLCLIGFGFSSNFVLFAGKTAQLFGVDKLGIIYPYIFLAYGIAGVIGPFAGGWLFDLNQNYEMALMVSGIMTLSGGLLYFFSLKKING